MSVQINVAANQAALTASIQAGVQAYNQRFAQNNQLNLTINPRAFSQPLGRITGDVKDFEAALAASNARVIAFGASTAVLGGVIRSFKELANVTIEVEKNLADINRVFGLTTSQLQKFSTDLFNVTKQTASSFNDASQAALEFSRQGLKAEETLQRTKDALTLTRLAGISTANAVDALTSTVNGFAATGITTSQILNKLVAVEQDFAVGAGDLAEALSRTGQAAQEAGVSLDQLNALVTSAQQSTARGGAVIGNALKTIFTRLQRTDTLDQLEAFNISVRDVQGNILPAVTILQNFAGAYKNLADAQRAQLSEQVAGVYQVNILKAIVNDLNKSQGVYAGALQRGAMATNEAEVATAKLNQTLDALLKQTATSTQQLANNIGKVTFEPLARYGTEQLKSLVESMNEILEGEGIGSTFANGLLKGIRNILAGPGAIAAFFTLFKLIQNSFTYLTQALPQIAGITTETQNRKNIEQSILQIMAQQGPVAQALAGTMGNQAAQAQLLLQVARQQTAEYQTQTALARQLAAQLAGQGVRVRGSGGLQVTRAGGYIPASTKLAEVVGAQAGGYSPGRVVPSPVGGVMNTAEDVKYIPGFAQPFINPPARSKAGRAHRQNAISRTGVDPYMASGFLPNFSNPKDVIDKSFTGKLNFLKITSNTEKKEIQEVADLEIVKGIGKNAETINDNIAGTGIKYDVQQYQGSKTNEKYREEAAKLALSGKIDKITKAMPNNKKSLFNGKQWQDNLQTLKDNKIDLTNTALLSKLKLQVPSLSTGEMIDFGKQYTGLLNALSGEAFERDIANKKESDFIRSEKGNARLDFIYINKDQAYSGGEAKLGKVTLGNLVAKAIESTGRTYDNGDPDEINFSKPIKLFVPAKHKLLNNGFIPNFSPLIDDNARNKHDFPGGLAMLPIPDKALQNIVNRQKKRQMTYLDFDRTLVRTMGDIVYSRVSPDKRQGVLNKMFEKQEARLSDIKNSKLTQFGELLRQKINAGLIDPNLLGIMTASGKVEGMPEFISNVWKIPKANQVFRALPGTKEARLADLGVSASGFIPNFAPPTSAMRIPWFKKFGNASFDAIQPTLGISKASDTDTFRSSQFRSKAFDKAAIDGDPNLFAPLYEDFAFKAMQLISQSDIKDDLMRGYVLQPGTDQKQSALDAVYRKKGIGVEYKGYPKKNLTGTIGGELKRKYETLSKTNPEEAAKLQELIIAFNEVGHENQLPSDFGKNFSQLAGTSYSEMVKNSPDLVKGLSEETNMLLNRYVKNPAFLSMSAAKGFIPNFANPKIKINSGKDAVESFYSKGSEVKGKKLTGGVKAFPVPETTDLYSVGSSSVSIPGSGFGISLYDAVLAEVSKKGAWLTSDRFTVSDKARRIWDGYRKLRKGDVKNKKLPMKHWFLDPAFNNGSYEFPMNPQDLSKNKSTWPPENDPVWSLQYAYQFKKSQLENKMSSGFIPNFANYNTDALERMTMEFAQKGKNGATLQDFTQFVIDLNNNKYGVGDSFHKDIIAKNFGEIVSDNDLVSPRYANTYLKGSYDKNSGKVIYYKSIAQQLDPLFERKHPYIKTVENELKVRFAKRQQYALVKPRIETDYGTFHKQHPDPSTVNHFNNGFIPNFNFIKGRNSFQKNWLIETAKKRNLNLNDPNTFTKLATEFAKTYPNDQGMFGLSKGFIPNFAYKQSVMSLEESMSGEKAIFDTKPFPHIRNSSQPTFSSAISDHGGLGNALSDSMRGQKAAGLMSRGFVPNFADFDIRGTPLQRSASVGGGAVSYNKINKAVNDYIKSIDLNTTNNKQISDAITKLLPQFNLNQQSFNEVRKAAIEHAKAERQAAQQTTANTSQNTSRFAKFSENLSKASTAISIAGPMLAGFVEQAAFGNRQRSEMTSGERAGQSFLSTGLSAISTGAGIGASFGLPGAVIGGLGGTLVALTSAFKATTLTVEELRDVADKYKTETQQSISAGQSYIDTLKTLQTSTDPEIIKKASTSLEQYFKNIEDVQLQKIFRETGADVDKLATSLKDYEKRRTLEQGRKEEVARAAGYTGANFKALTKAGYAAGEFNKKVYLQRYEKPEELAKQAINDFNVFFNDLQKAALDESGVLELQKMVLEEKNRSNFFGVNAFDQDKIREFLQSKNVSSDISVSLSEMFDNLENEGNEVGSYIIGNLTTLFAKSKQQMKSQEQSKAAEDIITSDFLNFRRTLLETISNDFNRADEALRSFESQSSLAQLLPAKLKEINDSIFSSIVNNVSAARSFTLKEGQARATATLQSQELIRQRTRTIRERELKNTQTRAGYSQEISDIIFGTEIVKGKPAQKFIDEFIKKGPNQSQEQIKSFAKNVVGTDVNKIDKLANSLIKAQTSFSNTTREIESQTKFKLQEIAYTDAINEMSMQTSLKQIDLERKKLEITLGQRDAANSLRSAVDKAKIAANERLELTKIQTGGEFRYLGLNKRQDFEARQVDLKSIFDQEQAMAQDQAIAEARRSIIEIAAQDANTQAQNQNTNAIFDLIDSLSASLSFQGFKELQGGGNVDVGLGKVAASNDMKNRNRIAREQFKQSKEALTLAKVSNYGITDNASIDTAITELKKKLSDTTLSEETKLSIKETITTLEIASKQIGSNSTIFAARAAQARSDFEKSTGFVNNMKIGFQELPKKSDELVDQLGRNLPAMFGDGLVDGIKAAIRESDNLGDALMGIASKFLDEISTTLMRSAIYGMLGSIGVPNLSGMGGKQKGGIIRAQSGMYISGTGSGDKYPALLENGEYVLNRKAVMAMGGPAELDKLNFSMAPRFASGGSFSNKFEDISSMEANMTTEGLEQSQLYNELRDIKRQEAETARQKKRARRQQMAGIIGSLAGAAVTLGISAGVNKYANKTTPQKLGEQYGNLALQTDFSNSPFKQVGGSIGSRLSDTIPSYATGGLFESPIVKRYAVGGASPVGLATTAGNSSTVNNNTNANNSFSFNTTVQRDGKIQVGANTTSYAQQDVELSQNLNNKVYEVILDTIRKEKRFGGSLAGVRNS